ncbi:hypothetical protein F511_30890 [Dorcoceras hygrometricum]|uniref:SBP-type domain-containing protein n=1 Tax=Dorcoceras hygrometricum TaxID=472368 RepID=A0A2Z7A567_9LAMI|nr:hypothetical protein F511_30890 [Dorcoceras hygrometricum]
MHICLNVGKPKEYGDFFSPTSTTKVLVPAIPVAGTVSKRSRAYYPNLQNPFCQVDGCNLDLTSAKDYHRRHRICERHSKSPSITVSGRERRFCQQCSRQLHDLSEFDDKKRSCRRRLSDHNARRRRLPPESSTRLGSPTVLSAALHGDLSTLPNSIFPSSYSLNPHRISLKLADQRPHNVLVNRPSVPVLNQTWENNSISVADPSKVGGLEGGICFSGNKLHDSDPGMLRAIQIPRAQDLDQCSHVSPVNRQATPDLLSVHSLLSYNPWILNEAIHTPTANYSDANSNYSPERHSDQHHWAAVAAQFHSSNNISKGQSWIQAPDPGTPRLQESQLLRADYESGFNHSNQRIS